MSSNNEILLNEVLRLKLLNNPFASCSFINFDFLLPDKVHFENKIVPPFLVLNISESTFSVSLLHFNQYVNMFYNRLEHKYFKIDIISTRSFIMFLFLKS